jgi:very-short-patch-repair endonuclease
MGSLLSESLVAAVGAKRRGIVVATDLRNVGVSDDHARRLRERGLLVPLGRGVDRLRDHPFDWASQCQAALDLAGPGAVLGPRPSARLHGFYHYRRDGLIEVYIPRGRDHRASLGRVLQCDWLPTSHATEVDGLRALTVGRTFFALCSQPDPPLPYRHPAHHRQMRRVYNDALARRGLTFAQEAAVVATTARRGRRGSSLVRAILLQYPPEHEPTQSDTEFLFMELLGSSRLPPVTRQHPIVGPDGFIGIVDFCWTDARVVVEIDSTWHDGPLDQESDLRRDELLRAAGWTVIRLRYRDIVASPYRVITQITAELGAAAGDIRQ